MKRETVIDGRGERGLLVVEERDSHWWLRRETGLLMVEERETVLLTVEERERGLLMFEEIDRVNDS